MAFIRDYFKLNDSERIRKQAANLPAYLFATGGGRGGGTQAAARAEATRGVAPSAGKAPLLADYLRANVGSSMAQKAKEKVEKEAKQVEATEWQPTTEGRVVPIAPDVETDAQYSEREASEKGKAPPTQTEMVEEATQKALSAQESAKAMGTQAGREAWLAQEYGKKGSYTPGEAMLDAAIMGGLAGQELTGLASKYGNLYEMLTGRQATAQKELDAKRKAEADRKKAEASRLRPGESQTTVMVDPEQVKKDQAFLKAERYRKEDEKLKEGRGKGSKQTYTMTREELANRAGMTLEEWILAGEPEL